MPGMSGLELLPKAKAMRPDVPVIMITAYGDAETKRKALENGAEALLTKPIDFVSLRENRDAGRTGGVTADYRYFRGNYDGWVMGGPVQPAAGEGEGAAALDEKQSSTTVSARACDIGAHR